MNGQRHKRISNLSQAADYGVNTAKSTMLTLLDKLNKHSLSGSGPGALPPTVIN